MCLHHENQIFDEKQFQTAARRRENDE